LSGHNREIRALFAYFGGRRADFLCSTDCVAEREGFSKVDMCYMYHFMCVSDNR